MILPLSVGSGPSSSQLSSLSSRNSSQISAGVWQTLQIPLVLLSFSFTCRLSLDVDVISCSPPPGVELVGPDVELLAVTPSFSFFRRPEMVDDGPTSRRDLRLSKEFFRESLVPSAGQRVIPLKSPKKLNQTYHAFQMTALASASPS